MVYAAAALGSVGACVVPGAGATKTCVGRVAWVVAGVDDTTEAGVGVAVAVGVGVCEVARCWRC